MSIASHIDALFPHEQSLDSADLIRLELESALIRARSTEASLRAALNASASSQTVSELQDRLAHLLEHIRHLRQAADESNAVVSQITSHMADIDRAKKNLELTLTTFRRISMLSSSLHRLRHVVPSDPILATPDHYANATNILNAASQLDTALKPYRAVAQISRLSAYLSESSQRLRSIVSSRFRALLFPQAQNQGQQPAQLDQETSIILTSAGKLLDSLGTETIRETLEWYCNRLLAHHRRMFTAQEEAGHLDNLPRRFNAFKKVYRVMIESGQDKVFPPSWNIHQVVITSFNNSTRNDLSILLERLTHAEPVDVGILYETLNLTRDFETQLAKSISASSYSQLLQSASSDPLLFRSTAPMSSAFLPHLGHYIQAQSRQLSEMFTDFHKRINSSNNNKLKSSVSSATSNDNDPDEQNDDETSLSVFPSSTSLFHFYQQSLERCAKLSTSNPLLDLAALFQRFLQRYALEILVPATNHAKLGFTPSDNLNLSDVSRFCIALNTANYCAETTEQLQSKLCETIDGQLASKIHLDKEKEMFMTCAARAILCLCRLLERAVIPTLGSGMTSALEAFRPHPPAKDTSGGVQSRENTSLSYTRPIEPSIYMQPLLASIRTFVGNVKSHVEQRTPLRAIFDKIVTISISAFSAQVVREKPISIAGSEQLLLDVQSLRACLSTLPEIVPATHHHHQNASSRGDLPSLISASYTRHMNRTISQLEAILKTLKHPVVPPDAFVDSFLILTSSRSFSDFQKVLDLKGVGRVDQNNLFDLFLEKCSGDGDDEKVNITGGHLLSSLDMEPVHINSPNNTFLDPLPAIAIPTATTSIDKQQKQSNPLLPPKPSRKWSYQTYQQQSAEGGESGGASTTTTKTATAAATTTTSESKFSGIVSALTLGLPRDRERSLESTTATTSTTISSPSKNTTSLPSKLPISSSSSSSSSYTPPPQANSSSSTIVAATAAAANLQHSNYTIDDGASSTTASADDNNTSPTKDLISPNSATGRRMDQFRRAFMFRGSSATSNTTSNSNNSGSNAGGTPGGGGGGGMRFWGSGNN